MGLNRLCVLILLAMSALLLLLAFISAVRALTIRGREHLFFDALIDKENGHFLKYDRAIHAQGLLYCATMNSATNDHIADFVKSAHAAIASAVLIFSVGAVFVGLNVNSSLSTEPIHAEVVGPVTLSSYDLSQLSNDIRAVDDSSAKLAVIAADQQQTKILIEQLAILNSELELLHSLVPCLETTHPKNSTKIMPLFKNQAHQKMANQACKN